MRKLLFIVILLFPLILHPTAQAEATYVDPRTDAEHLGAVEDFLFWKDGTKTASFRNIDKIFPTRKVRAGGGIHEFSTKHQDFSSFTYQFNGMQQTIADFIDQTNIVGLLVIKNGEILLEQYAAGNDANSLWVSFSVSKSITSMLLGAAIQDGYIKSVDEKISDYLPRLKGTTYEQATIRNVLQMSSGTDWSEDYADPKSDVNNTPGGMINLINFLGKKERVAKPGDKFNYNTGETNLVGAIVRAAIGNNLSNYLTDKIWQPFGMQADANWLLEGQNQGELGGCCISATLRDMARLGTFAMNNGKLQDGTQVLPVDWMQDSISPSKAYAGYGYLWWLLGEDLYGALGIFGQSIFISPAEGVIIVSQSAWDSAVGEEYLANREAFMRTFLPTL